MNVEQQLTDITVKHATELGRKHLHLSDADFGKRLNKTVSEFAELNAGRHPEAVIAEHVALFTKTAWEARGVAKPETVH